MPRLLDEVGLACRAETALPGDDYLRLARGLGSDFGVECFELKPYDDGSETGLAIHRSGKGRPVSKFELWVERDLDEIGLGPAGRRDVHAEWNDATADRALGSLYKGREPGPNESLLGMAMAYFRGVKGFVVYESYLRALAAALKREDPTAIVHVGVDLPRRKPPTKGADGLTPAERVARRELAATGKMTADGMWIPKAARNSSGGSDEHTACSGG